jgi:hypothetical protein
MPMLKAPMRLTALLAALAMLVFVAIGTAGTATAAQPPAADLTQEVAGTVNGVPVTGTLDITKFAQQGDQLVAVGTVTLTDAAGHVLADALSVAVPVNLAQSTGSCQILDLVLGPLDLDLLGLQIHLDTVHLNITAQQGPGNLLGNLLCAVAGLLDNSGSPLGGIAALLNQILAILG